MIVNRTEGQNEVVMKMMVVRSKGRKNREREAEILMEIEVAWMRGTTRGRGNTKEINLGTEIGKDPGIVRMKGEVTVIVMIEVMEEAMDEIERGRKGEAMDEIEIGRKGEAMDEIEIGDLEIEEMKGEVMDEIEKGRKGEEAMDEIEKGRKGEAMDEIEKGGLEIEGMKGEAMDEIGDLGIEEMKEEATKRMKEEAMDVMKGDVMKGEAMDAIEIRMIAGDMEVEGVKEEAMDVIEMEVIAGVTEVVEWGGGEVIEMKMIGEEGGGEEGAEVGLWLWIIITTR